MTLWGRGRIALELLVYIIYQNLLSIGFISVFQSHFRIIHPNHYLTLQSDPWPLCYHQCLLGLPSWTLPVKLLYHYQNLCSRSDRHLAQLAVFFFSGKKYTSIPGLRLTTLLTSAKWCMSLQSGSVCLRNTQVLYLQCEDYPLYHYVNMNRST